MGILARAIALASFTARRFRRSSHRIPTPIDSTPAVVIAPRPARPTRTNARGFVLLSATVPLWIATYALLQPDHTHRITHAARVSIGIAVERGAREHVRRGGSFEAVLQPHGGAEWLAQRERLTRYQADRIRHEKAARERIARLGARRDPG